MINVGDRVYHEGINGNGICVTIDNIKERDKYGIMFLWDKYKNTTFHNLDGLLSNNMGYWCSEDCLVVSHMPQLAVGDRKNKVTMIGNRLLNRRIRQVCELDQYRLGDGSDIAINYGGGGWRVSHDVCVMNRHIMLNKYDQCVKMINAGVPVPEIRPCQDPPHEDGWIVKPFRSAGGKGIVEWLHGDVYPTNKYFQRKVNKVREFRAHVFMWAEDKVPLIQEKMIDNRDQLCWNKKQGGRFHYLHAPLIGRNKLDPQLVSDITEIAVATCKAVNYDLGGVDLALDDNNKLWVFEINSYTGVREMSMAIYKEMFWELYNI